MSQPVPQNTLMTTLQLQMIQAIQQQTSLFSSMNNILATLNNGFNALTQAIRKNTEVMLKLAAGPKVGIDNILKGTIPMSKKGGPTWAGQQFMNIDAMLASTFAPLKAIAPTIMPTSNLPKPKIEDYQSQLGDLFTSLKGGLGGVMSGVGNVLIGGIKGGFGLATPGAGMSTEGFKQLGGGLMSIFKNTFGLMKSQGMAAVNPLTAAFGKMFPQMAAMALVMEPIMAFIGGLLEPFSMITDMFGAFGEILGTALIPVLTTTIMPLLISMLPIFTSIAQVLGPVLQSLFSLTGLGVLVQLLTPLIGLITPLVTIIGQFVNALQPLFNVFTNIISLGFTAIFERIGNLFSGLGINMESVTNGIQKFAEIVGTLAELLMGVVDLIAGRITAAEFKKLGFSETGWL